MIEYDYHGRPIEPLPESFFEELRRAFAFNINDAPVLRQRNRSADPNADTQSDTDADVSEDGRLELQLEVAQGNSEVTIDPVGVDNERALGTVSEADTSNVLEDEPIDIWRNSALLHSDFPHIEDCCDPYCIQLLT